MRQQQGIGSIEAGLRLLQAFETARRPLGLSEAAGLAGMTPSNAHRYLVSFIRKDFVIQHPHTGLYDLGPFALRLGLAAMARLDFIEVGTAALAELNAALDMSVFLSIWTEHGPTMVRWLDASQPITVNVKPGSRAPLLNTASGRAFLAFSAWNTVRPLVDKEIETRRSRDAKTLVTQSEVERLIEQVRDVGLGWVKGERVPNVNGLSAPVFDMSGSIVLTLTVVGLAGTFDESPTGPVAKVMREFGRRTSWGIGYREPAARSAPPTKALRNRPAT